MLHIPMELKSQSFYIPLRMMRKEKKNPSPSINRTVVSDWAWTNPSYVLEVSKPKSTIKSVTIDPYHKMADINMNNNTYSQ